MVVLLDVVCVDGQPTFVYLASGYDTYSRVVRISNICFNKKRKLYTSNGK